MRQSKQVSILCDTNILIYYMLCTPRFIKDVMKLFERCVEREVKLSCASLSLKDVFYITPERFKELMTIVPIGAEECELAQSLRHAHNDFEDDLIIAAAQQSGATYVVTYDKKLAKHFPEYCKTPAEIVAALE